MKVAFLFGAWSIGSRPLNFSELLSSNRGLTGSEAGICFCAKEMALMGHDVHLYTSYTDIETTIWEGVKLHSVNNVHLIDSSFDAVISWSEPDLLRYVAQDNLAASTVRICYTMLNDWHFSIAGFTDICDSLVTVCDMLKDRLIANMEPHDQSKWSVVPLGCNPEDYSDQRVKGRVIFTSSVDRGLHWLLSQWPKIKSAVPEAHLRIFYHFSYGNILTIEPDDPNAHFHIKEMGNRLRYILYCISKMKHLGVEHVGSVGVDQMTKEYNEASVFAFSTDCIAFSEGFSCSTLQSLASFTVPVITSADCLGEIYKDSGAIVVDAPVRDNLDKFTEQVIKSLTDQKYADDVINKCRGFAEKHTWKNTAEQLINIVLKSPKLKNKER